MTETELAIAMTPGVVTELESLAALHEAWLRDNPDAPASARSYRLGMCYAYGEAARIVREACPPIEPSWEQRKAFLDELQRMDSVPW